MPKREDGCVQPAKGPIGIPHDARQETSREGRSTMMAKVGKPAPDFEASAYVNGGFRNIKLSDFKGKWVVLCFYPGDFTFV